MSSASNLPTDLDEVVGTAATRRLNRKSKLRREEIIHAAIVVINDKGYAHATMTDIAASLGLRDAALYYYFPSKQDLAYACHVHSLKIFDRLLHAIALEPVAGHDKLRRFIRGMLEDSERHGPQLYFGEYTYLTDEQSFAVKQWADRLTAVLERFLDDGISDGSVVDCDAHVVVQLILGMLIWLAKWVPAIPEMTVDRLMSAIDLVSLTGLRRPA